jgi:hypothetical protein
MRWVAVWAVMMLAGLPALWARDDVKAEPKEPEKSKIAEEVNALIMAHQKAVSDYQKNIQEKLKNAKTEDERSKINEAAPKPDETMDKLWDLVEKNPNDKEATLPALQWLLNNYGYDDKDQKGRARVLDMLIKYHADDPKIGRPILSRLIYLPSAKTEELFRAVMAKNPAKDAKGIASLSLALYLKRIAEMAQMLKESSGEGRRPASLETFLGKGTLANHKDANADTLAKEAEAAFEEAGAKYGDVVLYTNPSTMKKTIIADQVAGELFAIRNLAVGKTVPDIVGDDLEGKSFKLSDYRGKVVVIDFWGNW